MGIDPVKIIQPTYNFNIYDLYKKNTLSQIDSVFKIAEDILVNLDEYALKELCEGYSWDIDRLFLDIVEESSKIIGNCGSIKTASFSYLSSITNSLDDYLTNLSFSYFVNGKLPDFNIEPYHLEWMNFVQIYRRLCLLAARGHSKSYCFSFAYPLWEMWKYDGKSKNGGEGLFITAEDSLAKHFLEMISKEIEDNPLLNEHLFPGKGATGWGKERLITKNKFTLEGKSAGSNLRGRHDKTFIVCDDFLDELNMFNADIRKSTIDFFHSVVMNIPVLPTTNVYVVGCVKGDTIILHKDYGFVNIIDLAPKGIDLYNKGLYDSSDFVLDSYGNFEESVKFFVNGKVPTKKITLDNGLNIEGSHIHPVWKFNLNGTEDWCKLPDLKVGDIIEIKDNKKIIDWGVDQKIILPELEAYCYDINLPEVINLDIAYLLGLWSAEGNLHNNGKQVQITNKEVNLDFTKKYGIEFKSYDNGQRWFCSRKTFRIWMVSIFGENCKANKKFIPEIILKSSKLILTAYLRGYFDGDGSSSQGKVACGSVSKKLIHQIQSILLMGYGIETSVSVNTKEQKNKNSNILNGKLIKSNYDVYYLNFSRYNSRKFFEEIGFGIKRKQDNIVYTEGFSEGDTLLPTPVELLRKIKRQGEKSYLYPTKIPNKILERDGYLTKSRLEEIYQYYSENLYISSELKYLKKYISKRWSKVRSIEDKEDYTYDFVIPKHNIFIGNGIKNHQTPMSEDDLYGNLKKAKGFRVFEYPAIYPDGKLLSPERFTLQGLLDKRETQGSVVFSREILVKPVSSTLSLFSMDLLKKALVDTIPMVYNKFSIPFKIVKLGLGIDLSISAELKSDYFVAVTIGMDEYKRYWVLNIVREQGLSYKQQLEIVKRLNQNFAYDVIMCENNQYQEAFCQMLRDNGVPVISKFTGIDKYSFTVGIPAISVLFEQGRIKIPYQSDPATRNMAEILMTELHSMTFANNKLQGMGTNDDVVSASWKGIQSLNYVNNDLMLNFLENN